MDAILLTLQLTASAMGAALLLRALPWTTRLQGWLETTWTHGKPLSCWVCLVGWCSLACAVLSWAAQGRSGWQDVVVYLLAWTGSVGLGSAALSRLAPIVPVNDAPPPLGGPGEE